MHFESSNPKVESIYADNHKYDNQFYKILNANIIVTNWTEANPEYKLGFYMRDEIVVYESKGTHFYIEHHAPSFHQQTKLIDKMQMNIYSAYFHMGV